MLIIGTFSLKDAQGPLMRWLGTEKSTNMPAVYKKKYFHDFFAFAILACKQNSSLGVDSTSCWFEVF